MKISTVLDHIDSGHMALPEFQRGYVWNRDQVRALFDSLYRRHPVGVLLVWATESRTAAHRGDHPLAAGIVKLLLDGQQRMTSIYGIIRGKPPKFFDGNARAFTDLRFNLESQTFGFYQPITMKNDPLWIDLSELMKCGTAGLGEAIARLNQDPTIADHVGLYASRLSQLLGISEIDLHVEEVTGTDKSLDVIVEIFDRVNSGGTKLSKGDLALAKICTEWPDARAAMKAALKSWSDNGYQFNLDWLLRSVNTVLTGEAKFSYLHEKDADEIQNALGRARNRIDTCLNLIGGRLGLDHDRVLFGRFAVPVMVRYLDQENGVLDAKKRDKLLFWFAQAGMWGRFSGSTESYMDQDLAVLEGDGDPLENLLEKLRLWHGSFRTEPSHFAGWGKGARFYPILYLLTRMGEARDWGTGIPLKSSMLGKMSRLEVHHIYPKARLYKRKHKRPEVNALANFCFQTKDTNLKISDQLPEDYFPKIEAKHPGALASQWIPMDEDLWKIDNYGEFLVARRVLLAEETNKRMLELLHGEAHWLEAKEGPETVTVKMTVPGGITSEEEEAALEALNDWIEDQALPRGEMSFDHTDPDTGEQRAVFDLAWAEGLQEGLSQPVAVLINEGAETISLASSAGFRCFTDIEKFKAYVTSEVLAE